MEPVQRLLHRQCVAGLMGIKLAKSYRVGYNIHGEAGAEKRRDVLEQGNTTSTIAKAWDLECGRSLSLKSTF